MKEDLLPPALESRLDDTLNQLETYVQQNPGRAVATAFGAGLLIKVLPLGFITRTVFNLAVHALPPALLALGAIRAVELCSECTSSKPDSEQDLPQVH